MKYQALFSLKNKENYSRPSSAAVVIGAFRVKSNTSRLLYTTSSQVRQRAEECSGLLDVLTDIHNGNSVRNVLGFQFNLKQFKVHGQTLHM